MDKRTPEQIQPDAANEVQALHMLDNQPIRSEGKGLVSGRKLITLEDGFAAFARYPAGTPIEAIIGRPAARLIVRRGQICVSAALAASILLISSAVFIRRLLLALLRAQNVPTVFYNGLMGSLCCLFVLALWRARHEASPSDLLKVTDDVAHREGILRLEEFRGLVGTQAMPAIEYVPDPPADLAFLPPVGNSLFRADNGLLLFVRPGLFWLVRGKFGRPVAPIRVWLETGMFETDAKPASVLDVDPLPAAPDPRGAEPTDLAGFAWLCSLDPSDVEVWHREFWHQRSDPRLRGKQARDLAIFRLANQIVRMSPRISLKSLVFQVQTEARAEGVDLELSTESISKMLGNTKSHKHAGYAAFRDFAIERLNREGRWRKQSDISS